MGLDIRFSKAECLEIDSIMMMMLCCCCCCCSQAELGELTRLLARWLMLYFIPLLSYFTFF